MWPLAVYAHRDTRDHMSKIDHRANQCVLIAIRKMSTEPAGAGRN